MANRDTVNVWNSIWTRVSTLVGGAYNAESPFGARTPVIDQNTTIYVETTGNDQNDGLTINRPLRTIQRANELLASYDIRADVIVKVGAGSFDGFVCSVGANYRSTPNANASVRFQGSTVDQVVGTQTGGSRTGVLFTMSDSTKVWTVDQFKDMLIERVNGTTTSYYPIVSNTATDIVFVSPFASFTSSAYRVVSLATTIGPTRIFANGASSLTSFNGGTSIEILSESAVPGATIIELFNINSTESASAFGRTVNCTNPKASVTLRYCKVTNGGIAVRAGVMVMRGTIIIIPSTGFATSGFIMQTSTATQASAHAALIADSYIYGTGNFADGLVSWGPFHCTVGSTYFKGCSNHGIDTRSGTIALTTVQFDNCGVALSMGGGARTLVDGLYSNNNSGCTLFGTGNTVGINCFQGGAAKIAATSTLTGTTEVSIDGTGSTLAAMRALTPKVFPATPNGFCSYIYE